jgi:hypothetical protein
MTTFASCQLQGLLLPFVACQTLHRITAFSIISTSTKISMQELPSGDELPKAGEKRNSNRKSLRAERLTRRIHRAGGKGFKLSDAPSDDEYVVPAGKIAGSQSKEQIRRQRVSGTNTNRIIRTRTAKPCSYCHIPYHHRLAPFQNLKLVPCQLCGKKWVPEVILSTMEPPARLPIRGTGVFIQQGFVGHDQKQQASQTHSLSVKRYLSWSMSWLVS